MGLDVEADIPLALPTPITPVASSHSSYDEFDGMDPPSISGLFKDAALYNQFLTEHEIYLQSPTAAQSARNAGRTGPNT